MLLGCLEGIIPYCFLIAHGVVEEKSSRVMEIMICAATPTQLLMGKLVGMGLFALAQEGSFIGFLSIGVIAQAPVAAILAPASHTSMDWSGLLMIFITVLYMVAVLFLYGSFFAAVAAPLSRSDEVQRAVNVVMYFLAPASLLGFTSLVFSTSRWTRLLSFFPPFTPFMMVGRMAGGNINWFDLTLGLIISGATAYLMLRFAARVYRKVILYYGQPKHFWELF